MPHDLTVMAIIRVTGVLLYFHSNCCMLVHVGACWCMLLHVGACWCRLVHVIACWCMLVHVGAGETETLVPAHELYRSVVAPFFWHLRIHRYVMFFAQNKQCFIIFGNVHTLSRKNQSFCKQPLLMASNGVPKSQQIHKFDMALANIYCWIKFSSSVSLGIIFKSFDGTLDLRGNFHFDWGSGPCEFWLYKLL